jgi:hypothetical protein
MLRLRDARTGELTAVLPPGRRLLRILVSAEPGDPGSLGVLRRYLTADLLRRAAERCRLLPTVTSVLPAAVGAGPQLTAPRGTAPQGIAPQVAALRAACDALNIYPPEETLATVPAPDGARLFDAGVCPVGGPGDAAGMARAWIAVADDAQEASLGDEPLAIRLMLMTRPCGDPAPESGAGDAARTLARWRGLMATWATAPSGAMSRRYSDAVTAAFASHLDTPAALRELACLADDPAVPAGVKFETLAAADHLLGLELARDIGR